MAQLLCEETHINVSVNSVSNLETQLLRVKLSVKTLIIISKTRISVKRSQ